jgi:hypothetical protein
MKTIIILTMLFAVSSYGISMDQNPVSKKNESTEIPDVTSKAIVTFTPAIDENVNSNSHSGIITGTMLVRLCLQGFYLDSTDAHRCSEEFTFELWDLDCNRKEVKTAIVDQNTLFAAFDFEVPAANYFLKVIHRNGLTTWSRYITIISPGIYIMDFTISPLQAYGENMMFRGIHWCFYSGDVNGDEFIDLYDLLKVYFAAEDFTTGHVNEDLTCDDTVDLTDVVITFNNAVRFTQSIAPCESGSAIEHDMKLDMINERLRYRERFIR